MDYNPSDPDYHADDRRAIQGAAQRLKVNRAVEQITEEILAGVGIEEGYSHNQVADYSTGWITIHPVVIERAVKASREPAELSIRGSRTISGALVDLRDYLDKVREWAAAGQQLTAREVVEHLENVTSGRPWTGR